MTAQNGYLPLSQEHDRTAPADIPTSWWTTRKAQVADFATKNVGLLLVIAAQFFFASMNLSVKLLEELNPPTPTLELITIRMVVTVFCCMIFMLANKIPDPFLGPPGVRVLLAAGGLGVFLGLFGMFYALNYLSVADATVITFLKPFTVALVGFFLLRESFTKKEAFAAVCSLVGVILIARPSFLFGYAVEEEEDVYITSFERLRAVGSSLLGVCGGTVSFVVMRSVRSRAHPMHVMTFFSFWCAVVASISMVIFREPMMFPMTWQWITLLLVITILGVAAQILVTIGLRYETATRGALVQYTQLLFAGLLELVVFGTVPSLLSTVGSAIIMAAQAYAILSKQKPPEQSPAGVALNSPSGSADVEQNLLGLDGANASRDGEAPPYEADVRGAV